MYSLVLMATLAAPAMTVDCHHGCKVSSHGCYGCYGSCAGSCYGRCSGGCYGSQVNYGCSGCYGSCSGCYGSCSGCYGSCSGCYGSSYYVVGSCWGCHGCYGCSGCTGCTGVRSAYTPSFEYPAPVAPIPVPAAPDASKKPTTSANAPARVLVALPADAKLFVDGQLTRTADKAVRTFMTPELEEGVEYRYVMKAEVTRDGQTQSETQTVIVKAGIEARTEFASLSDTKTASNK